MLYSSAARIKDVGPDRACAEWLLRCGAVVKWHGKGNFIRDEIIIFQTFALFGRWSYYYLEKTIKDYNSLPVGNYRSLKIESVDATDSAIMEAGFTHFK